jgi:hypothetical protein
MMAGESLGSGQAAMHSSGPITNGSAYAATLA